MATLRGSLSDLLLHYAQQIRFVLDLKDKSPDLMDYDKCLTDIAVAMESEANKFKRNTHEK